MFESTASLKKEAIIDDFAVLFLLTGVAVSLIVCYWRFFIQRLRGIRGGNWPTVSALIDVVSVIEERGGKANAITGYLATLTYFYKNPELQTGEYCRKFNPDEEDDAQAWAGSYKGSTVAVHVDPHDPTRSVLRKEEL